MTWLSEILKDFEPPHCNVGARKSGRRMARVIRELVKWGKELETTVIQLDVLNGKLATKNARDDNLSPDAKEVVNDTTTSSSN